MGNQEQGKNNEYHLSQPEVGCNADALISKFKQAIRRIPEFAQALQDQYFSEKPYKKLEDPIKFRKGDYCYEVRYTIDPEREELNVSKLPVDPDTQDWTDENITLKAFTSRRTHQFVGGSIKFAKFFKEEKPELLTNTHRATYTIREFLNANF
jgi:hypothetical protein